MEIFVMKSSSSFNELRRNGNGTDVIIISNGKQFPSHRLILSAGSPYLKKKLETETQSLIKSEIDFSSFTESTVAWVIDFLYLSKPAKLRRKVLTELIEIYHLARLLEIEELSQFSWEIINQEIDSDNYVKIWNIRIKCEESVNCEDILSFIIGNLKSAVLEEEFLNLSYDQMKLVLKRIYERQIPTEDYLLERIVDWMIFDPARRENIDLFNFLNFEQVTEQCINRLIKEESFFYEIVQIKLADYFKVHVFPKLTRDEGIENINGQIMKAKNKISSLNIFFFGYCFNIDNDKISDMYETLKMIEMRPNKSETITSLIKIPIRLKNIKLCFHSNARFFFLTQDCASLSLTGYNWKSDSIFCNVKTSENFKIIDNCCLINEIYIFGQHCSDYHENRFPVLCFSESNGEWSSRMFDVSFNGEYVASIKLQGNLHILFRKLDHSSENGVKNKEEIINSYYLTKISKNHSQPIILYPPFKTKFILDKNFIVVQQRKLYAFVFKDSFCTCFEFDPMLNRWNRFEIITVSGDLEETKTCYSTKDYGILFYTFSNTLLQFCTKELCIKPFWADISKLDRDSRFVRGTSIITDKIFMSPEEVEKEDNSISLPESPPVSRLGDYYNYDNYDDSDDYDNDI